jgi:hypothetical protein
MTDKVATTQEAENKDTQEVQPNKDEQTIGDVLETKPNEPKVEEQKTIGLDKFLEIKKDNKELKKRLKELEDKISGGADEEDLSDDISELAEEFDVDKKFISKLEKALIKRVESKVDSKIQPLSEEKKAEKIDKVFNEHFSKTIEDMPEFKGIVNPEVIKQLSLNPLNSKKTFKQLIEETYGNALGGKRTIESAQPRNVQTEDIDFQRASKDTEYYKEIMANPSLKAKYNASIEKRLML